MGLFGKMKKSANQLGGGFRGGLQRMGKGLGRKVQRPSVGGNPRAKAAKNLMNMGGG